MAKANLTAERLREVLHYEASTGLFTWRQQISRRAVPGRPAGVPLNGEYGTIRLFGVLYRSHRLAWLYSHGVWPTGDVDHINGDKTDNRLVNLRDVPHATNSQNRVRAAKHSKSGLLGAHWVARKGHWVAAVRTGGKVKYVGQFESAEDAHQAYLAEKRRLHEGCTI